MQHTVWLQVMSHINCINLAGKNGNLQVEAEKGRRQKPGEVEGK